MTKKKPEPNPIEKAIGDRATPPAKLTSEELQKVAKVVKKEVQKGTILIPMNPSLIPDEPSPQEMLTLEELNRQTEERLQDQYPEEPQTTMPTHKIPKIPASKPDLQPVTKTSSPESPPQKTDKTDYTAESFPKNEKEFYPVATPIPGIEKLPSDFKVKHTYDTGIAGAKPAEDIEFTNLKKYILEDGFVLNTVAFHIVSLCAEPLMTPSTTMWDFQDRAMIPDMVLALLNQPGYIEGIWPSLKIVMGSNAGNSAWTAGIATTIAFFDVIRTLPALKELDNAKKS